MKALSLPSRAQTLTNLQEQQKQTLHELKSNIKQIATERIGTILILLANFAMITLLCVSHTIDFEIIAKRNVPELKGHEKDVEALLGDYSDYYISLDKDKNYIDHTISDIQDGDDIYLLIPDNVSEKNLVIDFNTSWDEYLTSYKCDFTKNSVYTVKNKNIHLLKSNMQFLYLDVDADEFNDMNSAEKKTDMEVAAIASSRSTQEYAAVLKPRGSASWNMYNRKPYTLKFAEKNNMFGLGNYKKYNLLSNSTDKTLLKDEIFFDLARNMDLDYTPRVKNVNLIINGTYKGVYTVSTKIDVKKSLVDLKTGDFLISWEAPNCSNKIEIDCDFWLDDDPDAGTYIDLVWPETGATDSSTNSLVHKKVQEFIDVLEGRKEGNLSDYIDLTSFAKYYWIEEISLNGDAWSRSNYTYYKADEGKFYAGPVWDFEWALGSKLEKDGYRFSSPEGWVIRNSGYFKQLFKHKEFVKEVERIYNTYDMESLMHESYENYCKRAENLSVEGNANFIEGAEEFNWYDFDYGIVDSYEDFVRYKTDFYKQRIEWIVNEQKGV